MCIWGIPPAGTAEGSAFWASFWPALWSGTISSVIGGLLAGVIVGIVVLRQQRGWEARSARRTYERELSLLLHDLRNALCAPEVINISSAHESMPVSAAAALVHLRTTPLSLWRDHLPSNAPLLDAALNLQRRAAEFLATARELDSKLQQLVRSYNHLKQAMSYHDDSIRKYVIGRILGLGAEKLLPWVRDDLNTDTPFEVIWQGLAADVSVQALAKRFVERRQAVMNQALALQREIDA